MIDPQPADARRRTAWNMMTRLDYRWLLAGLGAVLILGVAAIAWNLREHQVIYFTDADTIRRQVDIASVRDVLWRPAMRLPLPVNTDDDEYGPGLSADGLTLFFVRGRAGHNADIVHCTRTPSGWSAPQSLEAINSEADELGPHPSPDGRSLYFYSNRAGGQGGYDLWVSRRGEDGWQPPLNLGPLVNSPYHDYAPSLTPSGETLYFASNRPRPDDADTPNADAWPETVRKDLEQRDYDIYAATISDDVAQAARAVAELNTPYNDAAPAMSPVGDFIYFSSDRPGGQGGFDLYRARLVEGTYAEAKNLGRAVNSAGNDLDPSVGLGGFGLHFASDRRADGPEGYDLYHTTSREVFRETETYRATIDWQALVAVLGPYVLGSLLVVLVLLVLARILHRLEYERIGLLTRCLLVSLLVHMLLLLGLTGWAVSTSLSRWAREGRGTRVALVSPSVDRGLASQLRSGLTSVEVRTRFQSATRQRFAPDREQPDVIVDAMSLPRAEIEAPDDPEVESVVREQEPKSPDAPWQETIDVAGGDEVVAVDLPPEAVRMSVTESSGPDTAVAKAPPQAAPVKTRAPQVQPPDFEAVLTPQSQEMLEGTRAKQIFVATDVAQDSDAQPPAPVSSPAGVVAAAPNALDVDLPIVHEPGAWPRGDIKAQVVAELSETTRFASTARLLPGPAPEMIIPVTPDRVELAADDEMFASPIVQHAEASGHEPGLGVGVVLSPGVMPAIDIALPVAHSTAAAQTVESEPPVLADSGEAERFASTAALVPAPASRQVIVSTPGSPDVVENDATVTAPIVPRTATPRRRPVLTIPGRSSTEMTASVSVELPALPQEAQPALTQDQREVEVPLDLASARAFDAAQWSEQIDAPLARVDPAQAPLTEDEPSVVPVSASGAVSQRSLSLEPEAPLDVAAHELELPHVPEEKSDRDRETQEGLRVVAVDSPRYASFKGTPRELSNVEFVELPLPPRHIDISEPSVIREHTPPAASAAPKFPDHPVKATETMLTAQSDQVDLPLLEEGSFAERQTMPGEVALSAPDAPRAPMPDVTSQDMPAPALMLVKLDLPDPAQEFDDSALLTDLVRHPLEVESAVVDRDTLRVEADRQFNPEALALDLKLPTRRTLALSPYTHRAPEERKPLVENMGGSKATEEAVALALDWLARHQSPNGRWDGAHFDDRCGQCRGPTKTKVDIALTGLSVLCFLAADHTHAKDGPYKDVVRRGIEWLVKQQRPGGDLLGSETMYSHGIATIALAEAYGMTGDRRLAEPVKAAAAFIVEARNRRVGGWRYGPGQVGDTSVLGWQMMALRSAEKARIDVPPEAAETARKWLTLVSRPSQRGLYSYQPNRQATPAMTAEGMFVQQLLGVARDDPRMQASAEYLLAHRPDWSTDANTYFWYYATLALFQHQGDEWAQWNEAVKDQLLAHQITGGRAAGSWAPDDRWAEVGGRIYQTALCTLTLEVYYRYLPRFLNKPTS